MHSGAILSNTLIEIEIPLAILNSSNSLNVKQSLFFLLLLVSVRLVDAQSYTVETVPNTKLINNSYVVNPDQLLSEQTVGEINLILDSLEKKTSAQVAVVVLNSIGEEDIFNFAQSLFVKWGIGKSDNDNGLLILYVQDKRTLRFHTGYGLEGMLPDAICKRIQSQSMLPRFKEGNIDAGMKAGIEELNKILTDPSSAAEIKEVNSTTEDISEQGAISFLLVPIWLIIGLIGYFSKRKSGFSNSKKFSSEVPHSKMSSGAWSLWFFFLPIVLFIVLGFASDWFIYIGGLYGYAALLGLTKYKRVVKEANSWFAKEEYHAVHHFLNDQKAGFIAMAIFFPLPFIFVYLHLRKKIKSIRTNPRTCKNCGGKMIRLDEVAEDEYLSKESQFEENLKSIDYDVWKCSGCGQVSLEAYINEKTKFSECPKCKTYAFYTASSTTKVSATTSHSGTMEVVKECKFCNHRKIDTESIPMIVVSDSSSSSSSSSSSGGSWGGGSSGGGGASSSW